MVLANYHAYKYTSNMVQQQKVMKQYICQNKPFGTHETNG